MFWISVVCSVAAYAGFILATELPIKVLFLLFGLPGMAAGIYGMEKDVTNKIPDICWILFLVFNCVAGLVGALSGVFLLKIYFGFQPVILGPVVMK